MRKNHAGHTLIELTLVILVIGIISAGTWIIQPYLQILQTRQLVQDVTSLLQFSVQSSRIRSQEMLVTCLPQAKLIQLSPTEYPAVILQSIKFPQSIALTCPTRMYINPQGKVRTHASERAEQTQAQYDIGEHRLNLDISTGYVYSN